MNLGERRLLVARIGVGMEEAQRHRLHAIGPEIVENRLQPGQVERRHLLALVVHTAGKLTAQIARHEGLRLLVVQIEEIRPVAAGDFQRIAEPLGGDETHPDSLALRQCVDDDRRSVCEEIDGCRVDASFFENLEHAFLEIGRRRVGLGGDDPGNPAFAVAFECHQVRERTADVGRHAYCLVRHHAAPVACLFCLSRKQAAPGSLSCSAILTLLSE